METLIPKIDIKQTSENVKNFFKYDYPGISRRAGKNPTGLKAVMMDGMPKQPSFRNANEDSITDHIQRMAEYEQVVKAIRGVDVTSQDIIILNLIENNSTEWCYKRLHMTPTVYHKYKKYALNAFADSYEYCTFGEVDLHSFEK